MKVGMQFTLTETVTENNVAAVAGKGFLPVYATPSMVALMEKCAAACVQPELADGDTTVGTVVNVRHLSATPIGMQVSCTATLTEIDGRRLVFALTASDEKGPIGEGTHERYVVTVDRFMSKCQAKLD